MAQVKQIMEQMMTYITAPNMTQITGADDGANYDTYYADYGEDYSADYGAEYADFGADYGADGGNLSFLGGN